MKGGIKDLAHFVLDVICTILLVNHVGLAIFVTKWAILLGVVQQGVDRELH